MKCKECECFIKIQNTEETGIGLCTLNDSYQPTNQEYECPYTPKKPTCGDCARLGDTGCFTCLPEDPATIDGRLCGGFISKEEVMIENILTQWRIQGRDYESVIKDIMERVKQAKVPKKKKNS